MKVAISSTGPNLDAPVDMRFGRAPYFIIVDTETMAFEVIPNPHVNATGGAGIQAAQLIGNRDIQAIISGIPGPNAFQTLQAIGIPVYQARGGTVRQEIEAFKQNQLIRVTQPGPSFGGMGFGRRMGGMGMRRNFPPPAAPGVAQRARPPAASRVDELRDLKQQAEELRKQLENIARRIQNLEKSGSS